MRLWRGNPTVARRRAGTSTTRAQGAPSPVEGRRRARWGPRVVVALACFAWFGAPVRGQEAARAGATQVESDPIECWWKTDKDAVRVGEPFTLALTCGVIDTSAVHVTIDPARLDPAALEMRPFEVLGGTRHQEFAAPPWRYFQYTYTLRLLGDEFFGRDVDIAALPLTYRVQSGGGQAEQGRDRLYLLPALPVRVLTLVPVTASDIRDSPTDTFADIASRRWRATLEFSAAAILFAVTALLVGIAVARARGRVREGESVAVPPLPAHEVLRACEREARRVRSTAIAGWTPDLIERVLSLFRVAAASALGGTVAKTLADRRTRPREGQIAVDTGLWRPQRVLVSAPTTAAAITARLAGDPDDLAGDRREALEDMAAPLHVFGTAYYGRGIHLDTEVLDDALDRGMRGLNRLRFARPWPARAAEIVARTAAALRGAIWAR